MSRTLPAERDTTREVPTNVKLSPEQAHELLSDSEKTAYEAMSDVLHRANDDIILVYWEVASMVLDKLNKDEIRKDSIRLMQIAMGYSGNTGGGGPLYDAIRMVRTYETKNQLKEYLKLTGPTDMRLSYSHIISLCGVKEHESRLQLAASTLINAWSAVDLSRYIKGELKEARKGKTISGRPPKAPKSVGDCLTHITEMSKTMHNMFDNAWYGDKFNLDTELEGLESDEVDEKLLQNIDITLDKAATLRNDIDSMIRRLNTARAELEDKLAEAEYEEEEEEEGKATGPISRKNIVAEAEAEMNAALEDEDEDDEDDLEDEEAEEEEEEEEEVVVQRTRGRPRRASVK